MSQSNEKELSPKSNFRKAMKERTQHQKPKNKPRSRNNHQNGGYNRRSNQQPKTIKQEDLILAIAHLQESYTPPPTIFPRVDLNKVLESVVNEYQYNYEKVLKLNPRMTDKNQRQKFYNDLKKIYGKKSILFSIDIEAWEMNTKEITEIGISIYDPRFSKFSNIPHFQNIHIKLKEYLHRSNGKFVPNHSENFIGGKTIILNKYDTLVLIQSLINFFFLHQQSEPMIEKTYLVGHDIRGDIKWLNQLGVKLPPQYDIIDTSLLIKISKGGKNPYSLKSTLDFLNIPNVFLHNAGNDAYYTLLATLKFMDPFFRISLNLDECEDITPILTKEEIAEKKEAKKQAKLAKQQLKQADNVRQAKIELEIEKKIFDMKESPEVRFQEIKKLKEDSAKLKEDSAKRKEENAKARKERAQKRKDKILNSNIASLIEIKSAVEAFSFVFDPNFGIVVENENLVEEEEEEEQKEYEYAYEYEDDEDEERIETIGYLHID
ncbi:hypothetical protein KGF54_005499 [Candida jiufengensis]|uniref:uncharacterized protein n=1 Tax=Candida jiufengensis TaxID=497108 RepID=UPI0022250451|nr:uncharacterized protein KGF54_005499 [Candida jiufengensis]KAI5949621.1 hypothetical protein KGF54_005499 [Candida jiufengensis]